MPRAEGRLACDLTIRQAVAHCRDDEEFLAEIGNIYADADRAMAAGHARCMGGGVCCKFDLSGHRLYVSTGELAILAELPPPLPRNCARRRCPYQVGPRCHAHRRRPLGCRVFFCDCRLQELSQTTYERLHSRIRSLHQNRCMPYAYAELTAGLMQLFEKP